MTDGYWLTQHALDQATAMGVHPDEVRAVIAKPLVDVPSESKQDCRLAHDGRLKAVYNPTTRDVVTVFWLSHEWQEDRYQEPEQPMSGWINLSARDAEKLLASWGFEIVESKPLSNLWTHPDDPEKRKIPFAIPARGSKANGKGSYRSAAQACGVSVALFLKGPTVEARENMRRRRQLAEVHGSIELADAPDPLGINLKLATQVTDRVAAELLHPAPLPLPEESPVPALTPSDEKVLQALLEAHSPVASYTLSDTTGLPDRRVREALRKLEQMGDAHRVGHAPARNGTAKGGSPASLWWFEATFTEPTPEPDPTPDPTPPLPEEPAVTVAPAAVYPTENPQPTVAPSRPDAGDRAWAALTGIRVFEETPIVWPTGGIVIKDDEGNLYVARMLTEQGR